MESRFCRWFRPAPVCSDSLRRRRRSPRTHGSARFGRRSMRLCTGAILCVVFFVSLCNGSSQQYRSCVDRLKSEALPSWDRLNRSMQSVSGTETWIYDQHVLDPKEPGYGRDLYTKQVRTFCRTDRAAKVVADCYDRSGQWTHRYVYCFNPDYAFSATQFVRNGPYVLTQYGRDADTFTSVKLYISFTLDRVDVAYSGYLGHPQLAELVRSKGCQVISCRELEQNDHGLVELEIRYRPSGRFAAMDPSLRDTRVVLDPANDWRVVSDVTSGDQEVEDERVSYAPPGTGPGWVSSVVRHFDLTPAAPPPKKTSGLDSWQFSSLSYKPIPLSSQFYLQSVGLPELPLAESSTRFWRLMLAGATILLLGGLIFLAYARRRSRQQQSTGLERPRTAL